jgi:citrate synthase
MGVFIEHSMSPSAVSAQGVAMGRPNLPACVAASVSTFGGVHGPGAAHGYMLNKYLERGHEEGKTIDETAKMLVDDYMDNEHPVMGMGQPQHVDSDPRAEPIHLKQEELGVGGVYLELQRAVEKHFHARREREGKSYVGVNVVGSGNTALCDIGFAPNAAWCIGSVCRGYSCAAHAVFNMKKGRAWGASRSEPMVQILDLSMIKYVGPEDRKVPKQKERQEYAKKQKEEGEYKKWVI